MTWAIVKDLKLDLGTMDVDNATKMIKSFSPEEKEQILIDLKEATASNQDISEILGVVTTIVKIALSAGIV